MRPAAIDFLCRAFEFEEKFRYPMDDGRIGHVELTSKGELALRVASTFPELGFLSPRDLAGAHARVKCFVDDVDAHDEAAKEAGSTIVCTPGNEHGERGYRAMDPE